MQQSSALHTLETVLSDAVTNGDRSKQSGFILMDAMYLSTRVENLILFYDLLHRSKEEAEKIQRLSNIALHLKALNGLSSNFVANHLWLSPWKSFATYIEDKNILIVLGSLASAFAKEYPHPVLEEEFLGKLSNEFQNLSSEILSSDISKETKDFLLSKVQEILQAIQKCHIYGTEELKKASQSIVSDFLVKESNFQDSDKASSSFTRIKAWGTLLLKFFVPASIYDIAEIDSYIYGLIPKYEEVSELCDKVQIIICETPNIQEAFNKVQELLEEKSQKSLPGSATPKALPPSIEDKGTDADP
jgi:hypothetical protein